MNLTSQEDLQRLMGLLHAPSFDAELMAGALTPRTPPTTTKARRILTGPAGLVTKNGKKATTASGWWIQRRPEIVEDFDREIYGRMPKSTPQVRWEVKTTASDTVGNVPVRTKQLVGHMDNSAYPQVTVDIQLSLTTPENAAAPVPVIMEFGFVRRPGGAPRLPSPGPTWQEQVLAKGWGYAILLPTSVQADNGEGLTQGIIGLVNRASRERSMIGAHCERGRGEPVERWTTSKQTSQWMRSASALKAIRDTEKLRRSPWPMTRASRSHLSVRPARAG